MKRDLDRLMAQRDMDAFIVVDAEGESDVRTYMMNGARVTHGLIAQVRGHEPVFVVSGMEIEEARQAGLKAITTGEAGFARIAEETSDPIERTLRSWQMILERASLTQGSIGLYGNMAANMAIDLLARWQSFAPQYPLVGDSRISLFQEAYLTKDDTEIERIRDVARRTDEVLQATWDFIAGHRADTTNADPSGDSTGTEAAYVVNDSGHRLTIGDVRRYIIEQLMARGLRDTGMIFAQGRDAGFPHSRGNDDETLRTGQSIIFDLFPVEAGGGYHHDVTRTWCIGHAPDAVQRTYSQVMTAFDIAVETFGVDRPTHLMQEAVQDYFEQAGHATARSQPGTLEGYVHSLGHGIGLNVHERPNISHLNRDDSFRIGNCITIEPGLYYPERGYGVRIEDLFIVTDAGELESLTPFRKDLVLPLQKPTQDG